MRAKPLSWSEATGWSADLAGERDADLLLYFGARPMLANRRHFDELRAALPHTHLLGCSTGGQIQNDDITDETISALAVHFDATRLKLAREVIDGPGSSRRCGEAIGQSLVGDDLAGVFLLSDGLNVNGSQLVAGISGVVGPAVPVTGGLAGDGADFRETLVAADNVPQSRVIGAIGFYGGAIRIGHGSAGGWDVFGPRRRISRSQGNILLELDGEPALDLYERYLGAEEARGLPGTALLFPLRIHSPHHADHDVVRTVLAVDREARSMTFAGDVPEGWTAQLMRGNFDRLAAGAADAARQAQTGVSDDGGIAILVSCIGRRLLMGQRAVDEVEAAAGELGPKTLRLGFYSYGEISPHAASGTCELHNQTMTVTALHEVAG